MNKNVLTKLIGKRFGEYKENRDEIQVCCPFCILRRPEHGPDTKYKLYINIAKQVYNCFRCEIKGRLVNLFPQLEAVAVNAVVEIEKIEVKEHVLEPYPVFQYLGAVGYPFNELIDLLLWEKGFTKDDLWNKCHFSENYKKGEFEFGPSLLFPCYQFGTYRGFQARTIYKNKLPKYLGASNMDRRSIIYNFDDAFSQSNELVVTEGFLDAIRIGKTGVATLGKTITDIQVRLIKLGEFKRLIVFLDKDAEKEARATAKKLALYFKTFIALPNWHQLPNMPTGQGKKDPGDMTLAEIDDTFKNRLERIY